MTFHVVVGAGPTGTATALSLASSGGNVRVVTRRGTGPSHPRIELVATDATKGLSTLASGAATLINCAMPPYDRWPEETSALLTAAEEETGAGCLKLSTMFPRRPRRALVRAVAVR